MTEEVCSTCGQPMAGHRCPVLPTGAVVRGTAVIPAVRKADCPHCGKVGGHNNDTAVAVAVKCLWAQWERATASGQPFDLDHLSALAVWAQVNAPDWAAASKPRGHKHTATPASPASAPPCSVCGMPEPLVGFHGRCADCETKAFARPTAAAPASGACTICGDVIDLLDLSAHGGKLYCRTCRPSLASAPTVAAAPAPAEDETARKKRLKAALAGASRLV